MALLSPEELAVFAGVEVGHPRLVVAIAAAEALVAAAIGSADITRRSFTCRLRPSRFRRTLELPEGPLTELLSVTQEGVPLAPEEVLAAPWFIARQAGFRPGRRLEVTGLLGWSAEEGPPLPEGLRQALLLAAAEVLGRSSSSRVVSERLGDHAVTYARPTSLLPPEAAALLRHWRRP